MVLEILFLGEPLTPQICIAIIVVSCSTYLYNSQPAPEPLQAAKVLLKETNPAPPCVSEEEIDSIDSMESVEGIPSPRSSQKARNGFD